MQRRSIVVFVYFNSQPREGGWLRVTIRLATINDFNSQPREGGWGTGRFSSRSKIHFNSQPREGGWL